MEINAPLVALISIGLLIPATVTILLTTSLFGALFVRLFGGVNEASVSGPLLVTTVQGNIYLCPTRMVVSIDAPNVAEDLL